MQLDLNDKANLTLANVASLLASKDDSQSRQLRVTTDGVAFLSDDVGSINTDGLAFRLETWDSGNDYTGIEASKNSQWVQQVYKNLKDNWPNPKSSYID
tara:strand:+ start:120 stop:416 length:297 start_codon:yes stop_codon:yes gene_type:complete